MDNSSDSSSSSWVFVYGNINPKENAVNTFHLDCSQEPVQELTEQDLASAGSDMDSDKGTDTSDGISIISESEMPFEDYSTYNDSFKIEDIHDTHIIEDRIACISPLCVQHIEEHDKELDWKRLVGVGVVISAVFLAFYSSLKSPKNSAIEDSTIGFDQLSSFDEIIDKTISCACGDKVQDAVMIDAIKQCVRNRLSIFDKPDECKSDALFCDTFATVKNSEEVKAEPILTDNISITNKVQPEGFKDHKQDKRAPDNKKHKQYKYLKKQQGAFSGEWYSNMYKHREDLRKNRPHKNRAQWYFKRANARQHLHNQKNYRPYSG